MHTIYSNLRNRWMFWTIILSAILIVLIFRFALPAYQAEQSRLALLVTPTSHIDPSPVPTQTVRPLSDLQSEAHPYQWLFDLFSPFMPLVMASSLIFLIATFLKVVKENML